MKLLLCSAGYAFDETKKDTHEFRSDITSEVTGTNYTAGGNAIGNTGTRSIVVDTTTNRVQLKGPNVDWSSATISGIRYGIVYKDTGTPATSPLVGCIDLGGDQAVSGTTFTMEWNGGVVVEFAVL